MRVSLPGRDYFPPRVLLRGDRPALVAFRPGPADGKKDLTARQDDPTEGGRLPDPAVPPPDLDLPFAGAPA